MLLTISSLFCSECRVEISKGCQYTKECNMHKKCTQNVHFSISVLMFVNLKILLSRCGKYFLNNFQFSIF